MGEEKKKMVPDAPPKQWQYASTPKAVLRRMRTAWVANDNHRHVVAVCQEMKERLTRGVD